VTSFPPQRWKRRHKWKRGQFWGRSPFQSLVARVPAVPHHPARRVPVPAQVRCADRHDYDVANAWGDLLLAARAKVCLAGLLGVDSSYGDPLFCCAGGEVNEVLQGRERRRLSLHRCCFMGSYAFGADGARAVSTWPGAPPASTTRHAASVPGVGGAEVPRVAWPGGSLSQASGTVCSPGMCQPGARALGGPSTFGPFPMKGASWLLLAEGKRLPEGKRYRKVNTLRAKGGYMLAMVSSASLVGVEGWLVAVEVHIAGGLPGFNVVGLPDASCREARDRVRAAIVSSGFSWPQARVTVNLAPSGLRKAGSGLDLAMAIGVLAASGQLRTDDLTRTAFIGELGLDGSLRKVPGVLPLVGALSRARAGLGALAGEERGHREGGRCGWRPGAVVVPPESAHEALLLGTMEVHAARDLRAVVDALAGRRAWPALPSPPIATASTAEPDLADVRGQALGRHALEVAAAGGHHLLMVGPAGAGKTMLATRLVSLLPDLSTEEALEVAMVHSAAGVELPPQGLSRRPPFRSPHHSATAASLVGGGGARLRPGEISCAHRGVLFLDELTEFPGLVLDNLRQPLEQGRIVLCRASAAVEFPARFLLVAAMNACRCGADGSPGSCRCPPAERARHLRRISGPLLDRFDLRVRLRRPDVKELLAGGSASRAHGAGKQAGAEGVRGEASCVVAARVAEARAKARRRGVSANAELASSALDEFAPLSGPARRLLGRRLGEGRLSARGLDRVRRVALTVADLAGDDGPLSEQHVQVALVLREANLFPQDRGAILPRGRGTSEVFQPYGLSGAGRVLGA
jgi:magnesium chelatase family protein